MFDVGVTHKASVMMFNRKKQSGFLTVLDEAGEKIAEDVFFHFGEGVYPRYSPWRYVEFTRDRERACQRLRLPVRGDLITFREMWDESDFPGWTHALWTFTELWNEEERKLASVHEWRLVRRYERLTEASFPNFELVRKDVLLTGSATLDKIHVFGSERLVLYKADTDRAEATIDPDGSFFYQVEVKTMAGNWEELYLVQPNALVKVVG